MLMRFWSKISRVFLCMFLLLILMLRNVYSIRISFGRMLERLGYLTHWSHSKHFDRTFKTIWIRSSSHWIKICNGITQKTWTIIITLYSFHRTQTQPSWTKHSFHIRTWEKWFLTFSGYLTEKQQQWVRIQSLEDKQQNDYIQFYSKHSDKTKSGILIGFFLRILRICSPNFQKEEFEHIKDSFSEIQYPESFIHRAKSKVINIHKHTPYNMNKDIKPSSNINSIKRYIILPHIPTTTLIQKIE